MSSAPVKTSEKVASPAIEDLADDALWSSRCWFWRDQSERFTPSRAKRQREAQALILSGFGVSLRIEGGTLRVRNGFTHHPQKQDLFRFFRGDLDLPERIILLDCTGSLSFDVMAWLSEQGVSLIKLDWQGNSICLSAPSGYSATPFRVEWQRSTRINPKLRMEFCNRLITQKIEGSILALEKSIRRSDAWERAMETAYAALTRIEQNPPRLVDELRGIEGTTAAAYFRAWGGLLVRWRKRPRRPVPAAWRTIGVRSSSYYATGNQNAHHPVMAILNYAYAVLESQTKIWAVAEGYDPNLGIMHESRRDACAFVFDLMEPRRGEVDRKILGFVKESEFDPADFMVQSDGICRLNSELARRVVQLVHASSVGIIS